MDGKYRYHIDISILSSRKYRYDVDIDICKYRHPYNKSDTSPANGSEDAVGDPGKAARS